MRLLKIGETIKKTDEVKCGTHNQALWETACQDIEKYINLKNGNKN